MKVSEAWLSFGGVRSTDVGVLMREEPVVTSPVMRVTSNAVVPGRSGKLIVTDGCFEPVTVTVKLLASEAADIQAVRSWLCGYGDLILGDAPGYRYVNAHIVKEFKYTYKMRTNIAEFEVAFQCEPFRELVEEPIVVATRSGYRFAGRGGMTAHPVVVIEGAAEEAVVIVNGMDITVAVDRNVPLYIDCESKVAYTYNALGDMVYAGDQVELTGGGWYELNPDSNSVTYGAGVEKVTFIPHWRFF